MDKKAKIIAIALMSLLLLVTIPVIIFGIYSRQRDLQWIEDTISYISVSYKDHAASGSIVSDLDLD